MKQITEIISLVTLAMIKLALNGGELSKAESDVIAFDMRGTRSTVSNSTLTVEYSPNFAAVEGDVSVRVLVNGKTWVESTTAGAKDFTFGELDAYQFTHQVMTNGVVAGEMTAYYRRPLEISDVEVFSGFPWQKVVIGYKIKGATDEEAALAGIAKDNASGRMFERMMLEGVNLTPGNHVIKWNASSDGAKFKSDSVTVTLQIAQPLYCVIDLAGGKDATSYPVSYLSSEPSGGWTDDYKTTKLVLRYIEPGSFRMSGWDNVTLTRPFYVGVFEVTQKQYELVMGVNPSSFGGNDMRPVESVSWNAIRGNSETCYWPIVRNVDPDSFVGRLQTRTGLNFDLPTEAQWEYSCRAGTTTEYSYGESANGDYMWCKNNSSSGTQDVGTRLSNPWGLYDMHGNVRELCLDWSGGYGVVAVDPAGAVSGSLRVSCGGSWDGDVGSATSSSRWNFSPSSECNDCGFRIVRIIQDQDGGIINDAENGAKVQADTSSAAAVDTLFVDGSSVGLNMLPVAFAPCGTADVCVITADGEELVRTNGCGILMWNPETLGVHSLMWHSGEVSMVSRVEFSPRVDVGIVRHGAAALPEGTTEIGANAFANRNDLVRAFIPNSVTNVLLTAFAGCSNIVDIVLGSSIFREKRSEVQICDDPEGDWSDIGNGQYRSKMIGNNGSTRMSVCLNLKEEQTCSFKWKVSSESNYDKLEYSVDGAKVTDISGSRDWETKELSLGAGDHTIVWRYFKDVSQSSGEDCGWVDLSDLLALNVFGNGKITLATLFPDSYGSIRSVRLDEGVAEIGRDMFAGCASLDAFAVPPKVTRIGADAFLGCDAIKRVDVASFDQWMMMEFGNENANPLVEGATLYVNGQPFGSGASVVDGLTILDGWVVGCEDPYVAEIAVPEGVVGIGRGALADLYDLETVRLPSTLKYIASGAFARDTFLDKVEIPDSVVRIGDGAFEDCSWMQTISVGRGVDRVGSRAFAGCTKLARIRFEDGLAEIGDCAFSNCWRMMSVSLPLSVANVATTAFKDCDSLTGANVPTSIAPLSQWFAPVYRQIKDVTIPLGETLVCNNMFKGCSALVSVDIPEGVTNIGDSAFEDCVNLPSVELPSSLQSVGESAFRNCDALTAIGLPDAVCSVGAYAFYDCSRLKDVSLSKNLESLPDHVFDACPQLDSIYVPASVTQLGGHIFGGAMSAVYFIGNAPAYDADVYASTGSGLVTYVKYGTKGWDGCPTSRDLPQRWPTGNSYGRSIMTWDPVQFDVTFDAGEGVFHPVEAQTYACEQIMYTAYSLPPFNPVRKGYKFAGWWTEAVGGTEVTPSTGVKLDRPHTLYAHWNESFIVTVRFNACGGTVLPNEIEYTAEVPFGTLPVPTREHYVFTGWYTAASGGSIVRVSTEVPKANRELFAHWSPAHYTIRFNANNGTGATATQSFIYGQDVTLRANGFSCSGCEFVGWSLTPGGEAVYADGKTISGLAAIEDGVIDLYAVWTGNVYAVRFDSHGGLGVMPNQTFVIGVSQKLSHCTFTRSGYVFRGWALTTTAEVSYGDGEEVCNLTSSKDATVVLFAVWERDPQGDWTVEEYLNCANLTFTLVGDAPLWYGEKVARADKVGMMRSGAIADSQTNWIETVVSGAGQISFWWKANGEYEVSRKGVITRYDYAEFTIDGVSVVEIGDESDWTYVTIPVEGVGSHVLRWMYHKDESGADGDDCAWVSEVSWEPTQVAEPIPELPESPTAEDVQSALAGSADSKLLANVTDAATYNAYREWAMKIGAAEVKGSPFAWASFATDSAAVLAKMPTNDDLKVEEFKPSTTAGSFDFTVSVKDVTIGDKASEDNLKKLFGLEGAESLDSAAFSSENVTLDFKTPQDGKLKFTATPAVDNAKSFFMKAKVK